MNFKRMIKRPHSLEIETVHMPELLQKKYRMDDQIIYEFHNRFGVSIVKGWFTFNKWEVAIIRFTGEEEWDYELVNQEGFDYISRFNTWPELMKYLERVSGIQEAV
ncbi:hypothetical protein MZM54_00270 [[Brevibacterium] frigoritolerans]|nr:hypothetical protein [Peribacillus frigoritolerans]